MQQKVDYIQHHKNVNFKMAEDDLSVIDIAIYNALFLIWNHSFFETELSINRNDVMKFAKVGNANTYTKSLKRLHEKKYIVYIPSYNPVIGSKITMCIYDKGGDNGTDKGGAISSGKAGGNGGDTLYKHINIQTNKQLKQLDTFFKKISEEEKVKFWDYIENKISSEKEVLIYPFLSDQFKNAWKDWVIYKKVEKKFTFKSLKTQQTAIDQLAKDCNMKEEKCIETINHSIANGWSGLFQKAKQNGSKDNHSTTPPVYSNTGLSENQLKEF